MTTNNNCVLDDQLPSIDDTLSDVVRLMELEKIEGLLSEVEQDGNVFKCYTNPYFILIAVSEAEYHVSFTVNDYQIRMVAKLTQILSMLLYEFLTIGEDIFVDADTKEIFYGDEAYQKFTDNEHLKNGFVYCAICERYVPQDVFIEELQYCKVCNEITIPHTVFS